MRLEGCRVALPDIIDQPVVRLESRELCAELGTHRRQGAPRIDAEFGQCRATKLDILVGVVAPGASEVEKQILGRCARCQTAAQLVANGLADPEPCLTGSYRGEQIGAADAARRAVERARGAGVRVAAHQHRAGQSVGAVSDNRVADALGGTHVVKTPDAKAADEIAAMGMRFGRSVVGRRNHVIEDDGDLFGIMHL